MICINSCKIKTSNITGSAIEKSIITRFIVNFRKHIMHHRSETYVQFSRQHMSLVKLRYYLQQHTVNNICKNENKGFKIANMADIIMNSGPQRRQIK